MAALKLRAAPVAIRSGDNGATYLDCTEPLAPYVEGAATAMLGWAKQAPRRVALADRKGDADAWRTITYGELADHTARVGQALLDAGLGADNPLLLISENRIEAAVTIFAAFRAGVPVACVTPAYSAEHADPARLASVLDALRPGLAIIDTHEAHASALKVQSAGVHLPIASFVPGDHGEHFERMIATSPGAALAEAERSVRHDMVAKILFTSGSTGTPKGVLNTHRMLTSNMRALNQSWPFLNDEPPIIVDWLPWNHTFGGNFVLNCTLSHGGTLYIDDGKPLPALVQRSVRNSAEISPTIHLNAPRGLDMIARVLSADDGLARGFFANLGLVLFASAGLPDRIRADWRRLIDRFATRDIPFVASWGTTETAPSSTMLCFEASQINNIGVPIPEVTVKLAPVGDLLELRVKGPNITPGYLRLPEATRAAFDEEGYFKTGDIGRLADPERPDLGILIEGRLAEDFKLSTGVWVNVGLLRAALLEQIGPVARDVVLTGPNRDTLGAIIFLDLEQCAQLTGETLECEAMARHVALNAYISDAMDRHNAQQAGSSRRIEQFLVATRPLDASAGELTEKGTVNQRLVLERERETCERLHGGLMANKPDP